MTLNASALTRTWWAGAAANTDIHIEAYEGDIEGSFRVDSMFRSSGLTTFKSVQNQTNTWRGDRIGAATVQGRVSGGDLTATRIANEKMVITVDTTSYIRTPFDYQDDWTAPDFQAEYSAEHGSAHAKAFDQAHIIQLIKCAAFIAPASLNGSFKNGLSTTMTGYTAQTDLELKADMLVKAHKAIVAEFIKRDMGNGANETVTLIDPDTFNVLVEHKKLMNVDFSSDNSGNSYSSRRIAVLNGLRVVETPRFPTGVISNHHLGTSFNVSAAEAKAKMIVFFPKKALVTVEAKGMTVRHFDWPIEFQSYLDSYCMYTVGQRRPDAVGVVFSD